jgi:choline dehydrogenase-like flavoprotein
VLSDAADLASRQEIHTDICIVGAGPAAISVAHEMLGTDIRVCVLESGGRDVERRAQRLNRGQSVGYPIHRLHKSRVRAFAGTTRHWFSPGDDTWAARLLDTDDDPGRVDRVEVRRPDGTSCFVRTRLVVLAGGGIENPRLLLLSRRVHRRALGNDRDLVGRFFAERLSAPHRVCPPASARPRRRERVLSTADLARRYGRASRSSH